MVEQTRPTPGSRSNALSAIATAVSTVVALLEFLTDLGALAVVLLGATALAFAIWGLARTWINRQAVPAAFLVLGVIAASAAVGAAGDRLLRPEPAVTTAGPSAGPSATTLSPAADPSPTGLPSASAPASPSTTASPQATGAPGEPAVKRAAQGITLPTYYSLDLDADTPNWSVVRGSVDGWDIRAAVGVGPYGIASFRDLTYVSGEPTHDTCVTATALQRGIEQEKTRSGTAFCVKTDQGRWAWVKITSVNAKSGDVKLDLHVWEAAA
ncbi:hypothetical protein [Catellatospora bangladeshensis]|uniref:Uncharacterized protein n=1 Tax=Catellatospora bangladeshensis TaxID=310355 RepID=A0A8J3JI86_9ACTN|nr:hypothetical protein [Catellatospora bangladeshensis]GIF80947.1 hypothetical protein Cba03nite_22960 [Catellatospora bangladeshensis]